MEIRELRIGNYVDVLGKIDQVKSIDENEHGGFCKFKENPYQYYLIHNGEEIVKPIPLTEEILLKFGFYFEEGFYCLRINNTAFITIILLGSYVNYELSNFRQKIVFSRGEFSGVHQLQNLYFSLTGKELTVKK